MDEFYKHSLTTREEKYRKKVQSKIEYCINCQPNDGGDCFWMFGERAEIFDILNDFEVPEKYRENILSNLYCPNCHSCIEILSNVGIKSHYEIEVENHLKGVKAKFGKEVLFFEKELEEFPLLAMGNKLAKKIFKEISTKNLPITKIKGNFFRTRKGESDKIFTIHEMSSPPIGKSEEGRFNHAGQSHLYLSNDKRTAMKEVMSIDSGEIWFQEFNVSQTIFNILDLSFDWEKLTPTTSTLLISLNIYNSILRKEKNKDYWKPDYFVTRFIMDCAKKSGYNGIKYNSSKSTDSFNVVLFYPDYEIIRPIGNPNIGTYSKENELEYEIVKL